MIKCEFENGGRVLLRHITVGAIVVNDKSQVLLVKRAPHTTRGNRYSVPGGFLDRDEDTKEATLRELKEETGFNGKIELLFRINDNPKRPHENRQNVDVLYIVKIVGGKLSGSSEGQVAWFNKDNLPEEEEFAFDHKDSIFRYFEYIKKPFSLPILG